MFKRNGYQLRQFGVRRNTKLVLPDNWQILAPAICIPSEDSKFMRLKEFVHQVPADF
ncbi:hypothetical protein [Autumnicola psychrophila]|uniref:Uncharacterized protein n=1 Tax=Autumnicola psychrophila TaxID=3075592 RepID=A0ABU3DMZ3_9FLAO|nr:hypothetical protein [Zunongwangia sp. F225]MDT0685082.1 hypothetical protein [Zunongwangia sp. F225]